MAKKLFLPVKNFENEETSKAKALPGSEIITDQPKKIDEKTKIEEGSGFLKKT